MKGAARQARRRHLRYRGLQLSLLIGLTVIVGRVFQLQALEVDRWRSLAIAQHETRVPLPAPRGTIYDRDGHPLAVSRTTYRVSVAPHELRDGSGAVQILRQTVGLGPELARRIARAERRWVVLPGRHSVIAKERLERRIGAGVYFEPVVERFYPRGALAAEVLGHVDANGRGASGLELTFDSVLAGQPGFGVRRRDATGASASWLTTTVVAPSSGSDVHVSLDAELQSLAETVLQDAIRTMGAKGGDLIILKPETGELLALVSRRVGQPPRLAAVTEPYEPGSTLKPFTAAALLAEGLAKLSDSVDTGLGWYRLAGRTIHDVHAHGWLTLDRVLEVSSNVGIAKFSERLPSPIQYRYLRDFGFGTPTGIAYPSESAGLLRRTSEWSGQSPASLAMGYEIGVTPLQLAMAYGALANGGVLMKPELVVKATDPHGALRWDVVPERIRRVIAASVATELREVLARVVTQGTGRSAEIRGISVAGKTGTAVRFEVGSGYASRAYTASFVGLVPSDDPELVILVKLDAPRGEYYSAQTAAPVMRTALRAALAGSHWPVPPLMGEPATPEDIAGATAGPAPVSGPYVFALDAPLRRAGGSTDHGEEVVDVPDVSGLPLRAAISRLHEAGFRVVLDGSGRVATTEPRAGQGARRGERVTIVGDGS
jgi:cell division protein FtsI (penicillin-binding protein 3)